MSKQSDAKAIQGYTPKANTCAACALLTCDRTLPAWMEKQNETLPIAAKWTVSGFGLVTNVRCGLGGFAIKKMGCCDKFKPKESE